MATFGAAYVPASAQSDFPEVEYAATSYEQSDSSGYDVMPAGGEQPYVGKPLPDAGPTMSGGNWFDLWSGNCPCDFDNYWDLTGGRSPNEWASACGYGYECHTWNFRAEYLLWFSRGRNTPVLAETFSGVQGDQVLNPRPIYGNDPIGENARSGLRLTIGKLLADGETTAEGRLWGLEDGTERFGAISSRRPRFGLPTFDVDENERLTIALAVPEQYTGGIDILSKNDLIGGDAWLRRTVWDDGYCRWDLLAGYQFTRLDDSIVIRTTTTALPGNPDGFAPGDNATTRDSFGTQNEFHGGTLGFVAEQRWKIWSIELLGKLGLGSMRESVTISGQSTLTPPGTSAPIGFLTFPSNIGSYERNRFAVVPELNVNGVCNLSPSCRLHVGYSIIYWSDAVLAGNQIDPRINSAQPVGPSLPAFSFVTTDFVVQGLNLGAEYRW